MQTLNYAITQVIQSPLATIFLNKDNSQKTVGFLFSNSLVHILILN